jgi:hypothetical protein
MRYRSPSAKRSSLMAGSASPIEVVAATDL